MKLTVRLACFVVVLAAAAVMAAFTLADLTRPRVPAEEMLTLGAWQGSVAVFENGRMETPLQVTGIELSALRAADRAMIERGLPVPSQEALQTILEDLGS